MDLPIKHTGIVVVDVQGDFTEYKNGSLAVGNTGSSYIQAVDAACRQLKEKGYKLFATQDFHPQDHISFFTNHTGRNAMEVIEIHGRPQVLWPPHCVENTPNAELLVDPALFDAVVKKGQDSKYDSYSGFFDDNGAATGLDETLKKQNLKTLIMFGLATDYCVKATVMDALQAGFKVVLIKDLCRGVAENTTRAALQEMTDAGVRIIESKQIL